MRDSHDARCLSLDGTWQGPFPGVRIDHVLVSDHWSVIDHLNGGEGLSDHRYIRAGLTVASP